MLRPLTVLLLATGFATAASAADRVTSSTRIQSGTSGRRGPGQRGREQRRTVRAGEPIRPGSACLHRAEPGLDHLAVGLGDRPEPLVRAGFGVQVGVVAPGQGAVGALDLVLARAPGHTERRVVVGHGPSPPG